jgi:ATP-dependent RNA helicase DDX54/DBP10
MIMSDSELDNEVDITKSLDLTGKASDSEEFWPNDDDEELQDEILSSDEEEDEKEDEKEVSVEDKRFPTLELSDNEDDKRLDGKDKNDGDFMEYFGAPSAKKMSHGTFAGLGMSKGLLNNISRKGFKTPTPIQRKTIPLVLDGRDVVGMARTGSGKTGAFVLPMIEKLKVHSAKVGARAVIMSPSRELALQTLKVIKDFTKGTDLRSVLLVGGDSLEDQFGYMMSNPDM